MHPLWRPFLSLLLSLLLICSIGCGSDDAQRDPSTNTGEQGPNGSDGQDPGEIDECDEGQRRNPFTGACVDQSEQDNGQGTQCRPGELFNPISGDCEANTNPTECGPSESFNPENQRCEPVDPADCGPGTILGQACTPSGETLAAAQITIAGLDCNGEPFSISTTADGAGNYQIEGVPAGDHEILVASGSFSGERTVRIREGQTTDLSSEAEKVCVSGEDVKIMVLNGSNENMGALLDNMGLEYDVISSSGAATASLLEDIPRLMEYDILFFECNHSFNSAMNAAMDREKVVQNLRGFVNSGKSIYAADNAFEWVDIPFPDLATFGNTASSSEVVTADVMSTDMFTLLGKDEVEIDFDLSGMRTIESVDQNVTLHFRATRAGRPGSPLMYSYNDPINNGTVIYTSFHSSAQGGASSQDILDILHFLIFQL